MKKKNYKTPAISIVILQQATHLLSSSTTNDIVKSIDSEEADLDIVGSDQDYEGVIR